MIAGGAEMVFLGGDRGRRSHGDPDGPDGCFRRAATRPCEARRGYGQIAPQGLTRTACHLLHDGLTDCAHAFEVGGGDAQCAALHLVGVRDNAAFEVGRTASHGRDRRGDSASGAALGGANRQPCGLQSTAQEGFDGEVFLGDDVLFQDGAKAEAQHVGHSISHGLWRTVGRESEADQPRLRQVGQPHFIGQIALKVGQHHR